MNLNVVLDSGIILDILSLTKNPNQIGFNRLRKSAIRFWVPCCLLPYLQEHVFPNQHLSLESLLGEVLLLSSLSAHWKEIPPGHSNKTQGLISLDASMLPGRTIIWTKSEDFESAHPDIEAGDEQFVYGVLAEYEDEDERHLPFLDLADQQITLRPVLEKNLFTVFKHGEYTAGPELRAVETQLATYVGCRHCIVVSNGTDALLLALMAIGVKPGDEVITSPFAHASTASVIALLGAKPVFVDVDPSTYTLNPNLLESAITYKTRAIVPVNMYGQCADYYAINTIANRHYLPVIENSAQGFGATYHDRFACTLSAIGCTSFSPSQALSTYGEGGACFTDDDELADVLHQLRNHGQNQPHQYRLIGINSHFDTFKAAMLLPKLALFPVEIERRIRTAHLYTQLLNQFAHKVKTPFILPYNNSIYSSYTVEVDKRDEVQQKLKRQGIPTHVYYPIPLHLQPAFAFLEQGVGSFPIAEAAAKRVLSLPIHPYLSPEAVKRIVLILRRILIPS